LEFWYFGFYPQMSPTLESLNALDRDAFTNAIGHVFEHSPWIAGATWERRPFRDLAHLHAELCTTLRASPRERKLALIQAHPDLAGRLAQHRKLTSESTREQASAGLDQLGDAEIARFQELNDAYRARFGFPFVICARLTAKDAILAAMQTRLSKSAEIEFETALQEIEQIAELRLRDVLGSI
jgi:2-oxo-4-hydroxy-4-carboxy-5-ureidoimidazoline decarboxylase